MTATLDFALPAALEAREPPEARGAGRDGVRLLVAERTPARPPSPLHRPAGTAVPGRRRWWSTPPATVPAAVRSPAARLVTVHVSTERADGSWLVELRRHAGKATAPLRRARPGRRYALPAGAAVTLRGPYSAGRLWRSDVDTAGAGSVWTI